MGYGNRVRDPDLLVVDVVEKPALTGDIAIAAATNAATRVQKIVECSMMKNGVKRVNDIERLWKERRTKDTHTHTHTHKRTIFFGNQNRENESTYN